MIGIINYGMGNLRSVSNALSFLGVNFFLISQKEDFSRAHKLILPGVGAFGAGMKNLTELGYLRILNEEVLQKKKPILGICLGMQLFAERGLEDGEHKGLGWIQGIVKKIETHDPRLKVPHMGWNEARVKKDSLLFEGIAPLADFYFVHSYFVSCEPKVISSICEYGQEFPASIEWGNIFGTQFHPEKSQDAGLTLLRNFANREMN